MPPGTWILNLHRLFLEKHRTFQTTNFQVPYTNFRSRSMDLVQQENTREKPNQQTQPL